MNTHYTRTDLASEIKLSETDGKGFSYTEQKKFGFKISTLDILSEEGENNTGKPRGKYITVNVGHIWHAADADFKKCSELIADCILSLALNKLGKSPESICVIGLGNRYITSDAIGHETVKNTVVTRHLKSLDSRLFSALGGKEVSAFTPGVIGQTGIETLELIKGAAEKVKPELMIVIDALVARDISHLATTVQLTDAGIAPGSGIGNTRHAINSHSVGCPVIAIGVPTVVESSTLVYDALENAGITDISPALKSVLENGRGFFVTPKESDTITLELSRLLADAVNCFIQ